MVRRTSTFRKQGGSLGNIFGTILIVSLIGGGIYFARSQKEAHNIGVGNQIGASIGAIVNAPINAIRNSGSYISSFFANAEEVRRLKRENQALLEWRDGARAIAEKLETYEKLNNIVSTNNAKMLTGRLVAETKGPFTKSAIANLGSQNGVSANWVAVNEFGLIGRVVSVGKDSARILLLTDNDSRIPIMGEVTRSRGILIGDGKDAPKLEHFNVPPTLQANERILTSGDDGIIPRGIAIGYAAIGPDGLWRVKLSTNNNAIDYVKLIAPNYIPPPTEKTNGYVIGQGLPAVQPDPANATGALLPLDEGAAQIPIAQTSDAIAQAQQLRKLQAELEATKKNLANNKKPEPKTAPKPKVNSEAETKKVIEKPVPKTVEKPVVKTEAKKEFKVIDKTKEPSADANGGDAPPVTNSTNQ